MTSTSLGGAELVVPGSRQEAIAAYGDGSNLIVLAGGTIVMPEIYYGRLRPEHALLLHNAGLAGIERTGSTFTIGAMTTIAELEHTPAPLSTAASFVADPEIRAQATLGGNLCAVGNGERPRGDLQAALIALGGRVRSAGGDGERTEPVEDFLAAGVAGRLVLEVEIEEPRRAAHAAVRRPHAHAYTILAVCAAETSDGVRIGLTGAGPHGLRARSVEQALKDGVAPDQAAQEVLNDAEPRDDALASAWYRRRMLPVLVRRALEDLRSAPAGRSAGEGKGNTR